MIYSAPAIQELLVSIHRCMVMSQLAAHQLKTVSELVVKLLVVVPDYFQPAALLRPAWAKSCHEHIATGFD